MERTIKSDASNPLDIFDRQDYAEVLACGEILRFGSGEKIFTEGEQADSVYIILKGRFTISKMLETGEEIVLAERNRFWGFLRLIRSVGKHDSSSVSRSSVRFGPTRRISTSGRYFVFMCSLQVASGPQSIFSGCSILLWFKICIQKYKEIEAWKTSRKKVPRSGSQECRIWKKHLRKPGLRVLFPISFGPARKRC